MIQLRTKETPPRANDFARELAGLTKRLMQRDFDDEPGRIVLLVGAAPKVGCSTMARALALLAARQAKRGVWLLDLDFWTNGQAASFAAASDSVGALSPPRDGVLNGQAFWRLASQTGETAPRLLTYSQVGERPLFVSRFASERLASSDDIQIQPTSSYWVQARAMADLIIVDSPCFTASRAGLALSSQADLSLVVVSPDLPLASDALVTRDEIQARGGRVAGLLFNRAQNGAQTRRVA
ncbi:MAG: hypothetical protein ABWZ40_09605 [Caulobacterales bacterium]